MLEHCSNKEGNHFLLLWSPFSDPFVIVLVYCFFINNLILHNYALLRKTINMAMCALAKKHAKHALTNPIFAMILAYVYVLSFYP